MEDTALLEEYRMIYFAKGAANTVFTDQDIEKALITVFQSIGSRKRVLAIPPDMTRYHSMAGRLTEMAWGYYGEHLKDVLPALGTHKAMTGEEIKKMFGKVPPSLFRVHNWRKDVVKLGDVPASYVESVSEGRVAYTWPVQVNRLLVEGQHDLILSL